MQREKNKLKNTLFKETRDAENKFLHVWINKNSLETISKNLINEKFEIPSFDYYNYPEKGFDKINNYFAAFNAINFYYSDNNGRFTIERKGKEISGSSAAALIMTENKSLFSNRKELKKLDQKTFDYLFTGKDGKVIPKSNWRVQNLNDLGEILSENDNLIQDLVEASDNQLYNNGLGFIEIMTNIFDSYKDSSIYKNKIIHFNKRAQLLAGMIHGRALAEGKKGFCDVDELSVYADYVLPMIFHHWGILRVNERFQKGIEKGEYFEHGSSFEVEYRAATIQIADLMVGEINKYRTNKINNMMFDSYCWKLGRKLRKEYNLKHILVETSAY